MTKKGNKIKNHFSFNTIIIIICFIIVFIYFFNNNKQKIIEAYEYSEVTKNYGKEIDLYANLVNLPASYFKALTILECSAKKNFPHRFENHVYIKLLEVKNGKRKNYENITRKALINTSDEGIRNLATSWGPFQIMGYKCIDMKINIIDLRGKDAIFWGIKWIDETYGNILREKRFKDAFHYHNTGKLYPKSNKPFTHNPKYVENGIKYMSHF